MNGIIPSISIWGTPFPHQAYEERLFSVQSISVRTLHLHL